jgi:iojap-like ribosome-associated protein
MEPLGTTASLSSSSEAKASQEKGVRAIVMECLEDMKAEETVEIDLAGKTTLADAMIIASGRSNRHVGSIAERIIEELKNNGHGFPRVEGMPACDWVLIDAGDVLVHVFRPEVRAFYNLEKMWSADRPDEQTIAQARQ